MTRITIDGQLIWKYAQNRESGNWVAVCPELHIAVEGETFRDLMETVNESIDSIFADLLSTGRLDTFLRAHGWAPVSELVPRNSRNPRFDIPLETHRVPVRDLEEALC